MNALQDFWNKNTVRLPDEKGHSLYAAEKEKLFPRHAAVCDLGGGTGTDSLYFVASGHDVTLVDIADEALSKAAAKAKQQSLPIRTVQCDLSEAVLPLQDASFDVVYSRLALHYFEFDVLAQIFAEIYRVLKPGGVTYLTLKSPDDTAEMEFLSTTANQIEEGVFEENGRLKTRYSLERLREILQAAGIPEDNVHVVSYTEKLGNENDIVKSGNAQFIVNEVTIRK